MLPEPSLGQIMGHLLPTSALSLNYPCNTFLRSPALLEVLFDRRPPEKRNFTANIRSERVALLCMLERNGCISMG